MASMAKSLFRFDMAHAFWTRSAGVSLRKHCNWIAAATSASIAG
jgi:hypothetical protein